MTLRWVFLFKEATKLNTRHMRAWWLFPDTVHVRTGWLHNHTLKCLLACVVSCLTYTVLQLVCWTFPLKCIYRNVQHQLISTLTLFESQINSFQLLWFSVKGKLCFFFFFEGLMTNWRCRNRTNIYKCLFNPVLGFTTCPCTCFVCCLNVVMYIWAVLP